MSQTIRTRFAPSPTGLLHLGHAYAAQQAFGFAKSHKGACLLRIEDIDHTRCKTEFTDAIYEDLAWLGFDWPEPVRVQSQHYSDYHAVIENLRDRGLVYRCFKTRKELPGGPYKGEGRLSEADATARADAGELYAWRLDIARTRTELGPLSYRETGLNAGLKLVNPFEHGDVILARKDIGTSYLIACTHDDAHQEITHIVRGADFIALTGLQRLLQALMDWPEPVYHHHPLLKDDDGEKLAKREHSESLRSLREKGFTAAQLLDMAKP